MTIFDNLDGKIMKHNSRYMVLIDSKYNANYASLAIINTETSHIYNILDVQVLLKYGIHETFSSYFLSGRECPIKFFQGLGYKIISSSKDIFSVVSDFKENNPELCL